MANTINQIIAGLRADVEQAENRSDRCRAEIRELLRQAESQGRSDFTEAEARRSDALFADAEAADAEARALRIKLNNAEKVKAEEEASDVRSRQSFPTNAAPQHNRASFSVSRNERTYRPDSDSLHGVQFVTDVCRAQMLNDPAAWDRLNRHMAEERVERGAYLERTAGDSTTTNWAGLVVPAYLTDLVAPAVSARRPFADFVCTKRNLPPTGLSVNISRVTTPTSAALQASELAAVAGQSIDDTLLTVNVQTAEGWQNVSRQAIERGAGVEQAIMGDLLARVGAVVDSTMLTQATTGMLAVATATTYDDTTPTAPELYPKILSAVSGVEAALMGPAVDYCVMHSRRWNWLSKEMTSTWPMINSAGIPPQSGGTSNNAPYMAGVRGRLPNGLNVVVDNNIATNTGGSQDTIYVVPSSECLLFEDPGAPVFLRAEQPNATALGVVLVAYEYFAYTFQRYDNAMGRISGTGLTTPAF